MSLWIISVIVAIAGCDQDWSRCRTIADKTNIHIIGIWLLYLELNTDKTTTNINTTSIHFSAALLCARCVYMMLGGPACIAAASTNTMMFRKFQCSVRNLVQSLPIVHFVDMLYMSEWVSDWTISNTATAFLLPHKIFCFYAPCWFGEYCNRELPTFIHFRSDWWLFLVQNKTKSLWKILLSLFSVVQWLKLSYFFI